MPITILRKAPKGAAATGLPLAAVIRSPRRKPDFAAGLFAYTKFTSRPALIIVYWMPRYPGPMRVRVGAASGAFFAIRFFGAGLPQKTSTAAKNAMYALMTIGRMT